MNRQELSSILKEHRSKNGVLIKRICAQMDVGVNIVNRLERALFNYNCNVWLSYMEAIGVIAQLSLGETRIILQSHDDIVNFIRNARTERGISQRALAQMLDISNMTIANFERGYTRVTIDIFLSIVNVLGYELKILDKVKEETIKNQ